ncbi:MAG TPA: efflux RND transporter periplasmic adaptor subunit [Candidatus Acidoferrum sp.]|nr:efflux RND transporter periplasmic adaptor subunit [Candidatus Acidoferrum sp.]
MSSMNNHGIGKWGLCALLAAALTQLSGCHSENAEAAANTAQVDGNTVRFAKAAPAMIQAEPVASGAAVTLSLPGRVVWDEDRTVRVFSPFSGHVVNIAAKLGDHVERNQALATLDSADYGSAQADYRKALAAQKLAAANLKRAQDLYEHGVIAEKDLQQAQSDAASADADAERAGRVMKQYADNGKEIDQRMVLRSPVAGFVVERAINPGQELRNDQAGAPQFVVTDPHHVWLELDARESDLPALKTGKTMSFQVGLDAGNAYSATIFRIADAVDPVTRTIKVLATADNTAGKLKGEMFITAQVQGEQGAQPQVPATAVYLLDNRHYAFVKSGDSFERRQIDIGSERDGKVEVLAGLQAGEQVVNQGVLFLQQIMQTTHHG